MFSYILNAMEELEIQGKKYISSKRASEITGYAKDYVGQLARGGKVPAQRVGRSWYVDESAIREHVGLENTAVSTLEEKSPSKEKVIPIHSSDPHFLTPHQNAALHSLQRIKMQGIPQSAFKTWSKINYLEDERAILPEIVTRDVQPSTVPLQIHVAKIVRHIPSSDGLESRIAKIQGTIPVKRLSDSKQENDAKYKKESPVLPTPTLALSALLVVSALLVPVAFIGGAYAPTEWSYSLSSIDQTAASASAELISGYFTDIFDQGIILISGFLTMLFASVTQFFQEGLAFILQISGF